VSENPLVAEAHSSTTWYTGLGLAEDAAQISSGIHNNSWVDGTLGGVGGSLDILGTVIDPLGSLVAWGVSWLMEHVKPLKEALAGSPATPTRSPRTPPPGGTPPPQQPTPTSNMPTPSEHRPPAGPAPRETHTEPMRRSNSTPSAASPLRRKPSRTRSKAPACWSAWYAASCGI
jgi:hypothetical protein